jgi:hypothetical protein
MAIALFIKTEDIKRNTPMHGSVDVDKFIQYVRIAQEIHIQRYLGTDLYKRLQEGIAANDLNDDEKTLLNDYIQMALIYYAMVEYLPFSAIRVTNGGVFKHLPENATTVDKTEVDYLTQKHRDTAQYYAKRLVDYLCNNSGLYPEYSTNTNNEINPSNKVNYSGGWFLGDEGYDDYLKYKNLEK